MPLFLEVKFREIWGFNMQGYREKFHSEKKLGEFWVQFRWHISLPRLVKKGPYLGQLDNFRRVSQLIQTSNPAGLCKKVHGFVL